MRKILAPALIAAVMAGFASPVLADGFDGHGRSAVPAYSATSSRTPLAGDVAMPRGRAAQNFLERSGATGGCGQNG